MGITGSIILFLLIWWIIFFISLPLNIQNIDPSIIWQIMKKDKKVNQENVIFILPKRIGEVIVCKNVKPQIVKKLLKEEL